MFTACYGNYVLDKTFGNNVHRFSIYQRTGIEIDPTGLMGSQITVGRNFHRGNISSERCSASGRKQHHLTTARSQSRSSDKVVTGSTEQVETFGFETFAIHQHITHDRFSTLLGATQRFFFERGNTAGFISRRGILIYRLVICHKIGLEIVDEVHGLIEKFGRTATVHKNRLRTEHLGNFRQHRRSAL